MAATCCDRRASSAYGLGEGAAPSADMAAADGWREWVGDGAGGFMFAICEGVAKRGLGPETTVRDWALVSLDGERSKRASLETSGVCIWRRATRSTVVATKSEAPSQGRRGEKEKKRGETTKTK